MSTPAKKTPRAACGLLALAAISACALVAFSLYMLTIANHARPLEKPLAELLPAAFGNWTSHDLPLSESEEMRSRVEGLLKFDDALSRVYETHGLKVLLYVAYWNAGKIPVHEVGVHTPDSCWVANGWQCDERLSSCERTVEGKALKPFEYGAYSRGGTKEYVVFWHLVGDSVSVLRYDGWRNGLIGRLERLPHMLLSFRRFGLQQRREQLFVRISSTVPFDTLWQNPDFIELVNRLAPLRIFQTPPSNPS